MDYTNQKFYSHSASSYWSAYGWEVKGPGESSGTINCATNDREHTLVSTSKNLPCRQSPLGKFPGRRIWMSVERLTRPRPYEEDHRRGDGDPVETVGCFRGPD
ncbi:hypothetical protein LTR66_001104 [Elasticomyces elasticus]|nr:hypothetical protein LTR66_001104 [Elasticomyces elasticus]